MTSESEITPSNPSQIDPAKRKGEPLPLEAPVESRDGREAEPCPNCGAPLRGDDALLCLRCGFDLKSMKVVQTASHDDDGAGDGGADDDEVGEEASPASDLVCEGAGNHILPLVLLAISALTMIVGLLIGAQGLYPPLAAGETVTRWGDRFEALARYPVTTALWTVCAMGSLLAGAWLFARPFGDARLAFSRVIGIAAVAQTARFLSLPWRWVEVALESVLMAAVFVLLALALFRISLRDAVTLLALTIASFVFLALAASIIAWAI